MLFFRQIDLLSTKLLSHLFHFVHLIPVVKCEIGSHLVSQERTDNTKLKPNVPARWEREYRK